MLKHEVKVLEGLFGKVGKNGDESKIKDTARIVNFKGELARISFKMRSNELEDKMFANKSNKKLTSARYYMFVPIFITMYLIATLNTLPILYCSIM